jgi:hypothetical protein
MAAKAKVPLTIVLLLVVTISASVSTYQVSLHIATRALMNGPCCSCDNSTVA